jgi:hypothetical protein
VRRLVEQHLSFAESHVSPPERHALDADGLAAAAR